MNRKKFIQKLGMGVMVAPIIPTVLVSCSSDDDAVKVIEPPVDPVSCATSPTETAGPFPIKTPADWVRTNIIGNKAGIPFLINFTIQNNNDSCKPLAGAYVDLWHCDAKGNYSEYNGQLDGDFTNEHFLRGRQVTNAAGKVSFISIYPGWYPGRAPHLHVEVKNNAGSSLLVTQVAFPEAVSTSVYGTTGYIGNFDTSNVSDFEFRNSLADNLAEITGNNTDGYTLTKVITIAG